MTGNKMKRLYSFLLCLILVLGSVFSSCSKNEEKQQTETDTGTKQTDMPEITEETRLEPNLPTDADLNGYKFRVLTKGQFSNHWFSRDIYAEEENGDPVNDAVFHRNNVVEEKYNFEVVEKDQFEDPYSEAKKAVLADEDSYDLLLLGNGAASMVTQGMLVDIFTIPNLDLSKPWYDQNAVSSLSIYNKLYMLCGDLNIMDNDATWAITFNKPLAASLGLGNLYEKVQNGQWTLDYLYDCASKGSDDINGDGIHDETDQWGIMGESANTSAFIIGAGERFILKDDDDIPYINIQSEHFYSAFDKANKINGNFDICLFAGNYPKYEDVWTDCMDKCFAEGRALFNFAGLNRITLFRGMETDFGILPTPKYDEDQEKYYNSVSTWGANLIMVPSTVRDLDSTGIINEALSAESMYTLTPAYYDVTLKTKWSRDNESSDMLDIIFSSMVYDLSNVFNWGGIFWIPGNLTAAGKTEIASKVEKGMKSANKELDKAMQFFMEANA